MRDKTQTTAPRMAILVFLVAAVLSVSADDRNKTIATGRDNVALQGYDAVAYFTQGKATRGNSEFSFSWNATEWHFSSAVHRDLFAEDPERYAPQFGGFCANGLSKGKKVVADPEAWTIVDGKLFVKFSERARDEWRQDKAARIRKAEQNWARQNVPN